MYIENLELDQGSTWSINVTVRNESDDSIFDLTGYTLRSMIRKHYSDAAAAQTFSCTSATPTSGVVNMLLSATNSALLTPGTYVYDLEIEKVGVVYKPVGGKIVVNPEATK